MRRRRAHRRYLRTLVLGVLGLAALVWVAMEQFGISRREMGDLFLLSVLGVSVGIGVSVGTGVFVGAGVSVGGSAVSVGSGALSATAVGSGVASSLRQAIANNKKSPAKQIAAIR